jgi:pSer/pThr/pTyr-binding forkhead associated (FHA) protein
VVLSDRPSSDVPAPEFVTKCHRNALDQLSLAFKHQRPLAILIGQGKSTSRFVIRKFLSRLDAETAVALITTPCANATEFMGRIISAVGFQPKDMTIGDLESVFSMFLSFQKAHRRRTVICLEEVDECDWWVLDKIRSFVETERDGPFGLTVVLSGQPALKDLLTRRPLRSVAEFAGKQISLAPFTLPETREYVRRRVEGAGIASIDEAFEYHAIPMLHELCGGVPDAVGELFDQCRLQAEEEGVKLVTAEIVKRAYESQRAHTDQVYGEDQAAIINFTEIPPRPGRLIVQLSGQDVREIALRRGNILIGRSELCDICIDSKIVSRHHALISYRPDGAVIVDLGSTNGTCVDGYPVKEKRLVAGDTITVGDCRIEYILDDVLDAKFRDAEFSANLELHS